ncbi:tyrosine-type recombinase/integrase [Agrilactobacillus fermenti]|uniref:tyrosine-type recombinase/integrase n=1 Tax=Agrilactobacillus fermenti TaxID=2586909 RepID=UPI003A5C0213
MADPIKQYTQKDGKTSYYFSIYVGINELTGKKMRVTRRGFKTKTQAKTAMARLLAGVVKTNEVKPPKYENMYKNWLEGYKTTVKESTLNRVMSMFKHHIIPSLGKFYIDKINPDMIQKIANQWAEQFVDYRKIIAYAALPLRLAERRGIIQRNPFDLIEKPKMGKISDKDGFENFWDRSQLEIFFAALENKYGPTAKHPLPKAIVFFRVLAFTGLRRGEILALVWSDINFKTNTLKITKAVTRKLNNQMTIGTPKTKTSIRTLDLDAKTIAILKRWKIQQAEELLMVGLKQKDNDNQLIFQNLNNHLLSLPKPSKWLNEVIKQTNLPPITIHGFRHTFASLAFESGATIKQVQSQLGHSDVTTTLNIYTHVSKKAKKETISKFTNYVNF